MAKSFRPERGSNTFPAQFESVCAACGWDIEIGETIKYNGMDEIVHEEC